MTRKNPVTNLINYIIKISFAFGFAQLCMIVTTVLLHTMSAQHESSSEAFEYLVQNTNTSEIILSFSDVALFILMIIIFAPLLIMGLTYLGHRFSKNPPEEIEETAFTSDLANAVSLYLIYLSLYILNGVALLIFYPIEVVAEYVQTYSEILIALTLAGFATALYPLAYELFVNKLLLRKVKHHDSQ